MGPLEYMKAPQHFAAKRARAWNLSFYGASAIFGQHDRYPPASRNTAKTKSKNKYAANEIRSKCAA